MSSISSNTSSPIANNIAHWNKVLTPASPRCSHMIMATIFFCLPSTFLTYLEIITKLKYKPVTRPKINKFTSKVIPHFVVERTDEKVERSTSSDKGHISSSLARLLNAIPSFFKRFSPLGGWRHRAGNWWRETATRSNSIRGIPRGPSRNFPNG